MSLSRTNRNFIPKGNGARNYNKNAHEGDVRCIFFLSKYQIAKVKCKELADAVTEWSKIIFTTAGRTQSCLIAKEAAEEHV